jgi:sigma-E factor negative regulatory protein RseA
VTVLFGNQPKSTRATQTLMIEKNQTELLESLSALSDGEASDIEVRRILKDEDHAELLREQWSDHQRIGSLLRGDHYTGVDISSAVRETVAEEARPSKAGRFWKPASQFAVAASVAGLALLGVNQYQLAQQSSSSQNQTVAEIESVELQDTSEFTAPFGFEVPPQTSLVSTNPELPHIPEEMRTRVSFDERALYDHVNQSIQMHSENASEANQDVYPLLRVPLEE